MIAMAQLITCVSNAEVRNVIGYLYVRNPTWLPSDIYCKICEVYGDRIMSVHTVRKWICVFKEGRTNVINKDREGRVNDACNTDTIVGVRVLLEDDCSLIV